MATVRDLKKNISLLMSMVLSDSFHIMEYNQKVDTQAVMEIAEEVLTQHREFRVRINNPVYGEDVKNARQYYKKLTDEALDTANQLYQRLSEEVKKVA